MVVLRSYVGFLNILVILQRINSFTKTFKMLQSAYIGTKFRI